MTIGHSTAVTHPPLQRREAGLKLVKLRLIDELGPDEVAAKKRALLQLARIERVKIDSFCNMPFATLVKASNKLVISSR